MSVLGIDTILDKNENSYSEICGPPASAYWIAEITGLYHVLILLGFLFLDLFSLYVCGCFVYMSIICRC